MHVLYKVWAGGGGGGGLSPQIFWLLQMLGVRGTDKLQAAL